MPERRKDIKVNLMTQSTHDSLLHEIEAAKENVKQSLLAIGEAAGSESDWHDNSAFDQANIKHDVDSLQLRTMEARLRDVEIIKPSKELGKIEIGNSVLVKFQNEDGKETFTILGPADSGRKDGWISYESPLGSSLLGKRKGDDATFGVGNQQQTVKVLDILPGDF